MVEGYLQKMAQAFCCLFFARWHSSFHHGLHCLMGWPEDFGNNVSAALTMLCVTRVTAVFIYPSIMAGVMFGCKVQMV